MKLNQSYSDSIFTVPDTSILKLLHADQHLHKQPHSIVTIFQIPLQSPCWVESDQSLFSFRFIGITTPLNFLIELNASIWGSTKYVNISLSWSWMFCSQIICCYLLSSKLSYTVWTVRPKRSVGPRHLLYPYTHMLNFPSTFLEPVNCNIRLSVCSSVCLPPQPPTPFLRECLNIPIFP